VGRIANGAAVRSVKMPPDIIAELATLLANGERLERRLRRLESAERLRMTEDMLAEPESLPSGELQDNVKDRCVGGSGDSGNTPFWLVNVDSDGVELALNYVGIRGGTWKRLDKPIDLEDGILATVRELALPAHYTGWVYIVLVLPTNTTWETMPELDPDVAEELGAQVIQEAAWLTDVKGNDEFNAYWTVGRVYIVDGARTGWVRDTDYEQWWTGGNIDDGAMAGDSDAVDELGLETEVGEPPVITLARGRRTIERNGTEHFMRGAHQLYGVDGIYNMAGGSMLAPNWWMAAFGCEGLDDASHTKGRMRYAVLDSTATEAMGDGYYYRTLGVQAHGAQDYHAQMLYGAYGKPEFYSPYLDVEGSVVELKWRLGVQWRDNAEGEWEHTGEMETVYDLRVVNDEHANATISFGMDMRRGVVGANEGQGQVTGPGDWEAVVTEGGIQVKIVFDETDPPPYRHAWLDPDHNEEELYSGWELNSQHDPRYFIRGVQYDHNCCMSIGRAEWGNVHGYGVDEAAKRIDLWSASTGDTCGLFVGDKGSEVETLNWRLYQLLDDLWTAVEGFDVYANTEAVGGTDAVLRCFKVDGVGEIFMVEGGTSPALWAYNAHFPTAIGFGETYGADDDVQIARDSADSLTFRAVGQTSYQIQMDLSANTGYLLLPATGLVKVNDVQVVCAQQDAVADAETDLSETNDVSGADTVSETGLEAILDALATRVNEVAETLNSVKTALQTHGLLATPV
jgi:hypothetical protein